MRLNLLNKARPGLVIIGWPRLRFLILSTNKKQFFYQFYTGFQSLLCSSYSVFFVVFSINVQLLIYFQLCLKSFFLTRPQKHLIRQKYKNVAECRDRHRVSFNSGWQWRPPSQSSSSLDSWPRPRPSSTWTPTRWEEIFRPITRKPIKTAWVDYLDRVNTINQKV